MNLTMQERWETFHRPITNSDQSSFPIHYQQLKSRIIRSHKSKRLSKSLKCSPTKITATNFLQSLQPVPDPTTHLSPLTNCFNKFIGTAKFKQQLDDQQFAKKFEKRTLVNPKLTQNSYFWKGGDFTTKLKISPKNHQSSKLIHRRRDSNAIFGLNTNLFFNKDTNHRNSLISPQEPEPAGLLLGPIETKPNFSKKSIISDQNPNPKL